MVLQCLPRVIYKLKRAWLGSVDVHATPPHPSTRGVNRAGQPHDHALLLDGKVEREGDRAIVDERHVHLGAEHTVLDALSLIL